MLIGQLSKLSGFSIHAIRFYEKEGVFSLGRKNRLANNYKDYPDDVLKKLVVLKKLKSFGFTLNECMDLLAMIDENLATCKNVAEKVDEKVKVIDRKIIELQEIKNILINGVEFCLNGCEPSESKNCTLITVS